MSARIRALLHELADAVADELDGRAMVPPAPPSAPRKRRPPIVDVPTPIVSEVEMARARDLMRRKGIPFE